MVTEKSSFSTSLIRFRFEVALWRQCYRGGSRFSRAATLPIQGKASGGNFHRQHWYVVLRGTSTGPAMKFLLQSKFNVRTLILPSPMALSVPSWSKSSVSKSKGWRNWILNGSPPISPCRSPDNGEVLLCAFFSSFNYCGHSAKKIITVDLVYLFACLLVLDLLLFSSGEFFFMDSSVLNIASNLIVSSGTTKTCEHFSNIFFTHVLK